MFGGLTPSFYVVYGDFDEQHEKIIAQSEWGVISKLHVYKTSKVCKIDLLIENMFCFEDRVWISEAKKSNLSVWIP